jgi:hypothetical protein
VPPEHALVKLNAMSAQLPLLTDRAIQIIAENKIRAAIEAGEFDNLPGFGKPAAIFDEPYDPFWWIRRKLKREQLNTVLGGARLFE